MDSLKSDFLKRVLRETFLFKFYKYLRAEIYNKRNRTKICSLKASLKAGYGTYSSIGYNTAVTDDVSIGDYSYIGDNSSVENTSIGKFCSISSNVVISPYEHNLKAVTTHPVGYSEKRVRDRTVIGNDVLISIDCVILEGVAIGDGAVVGAGAVVTKDVRPYEIVAGVPARHIGWRFGEEKQKMMSELKWWDWDERRLRKEKQFLSMDADGLGM